MSTVTLFSPEPHQAKTHPRILIENSQLPLAHGPTILGVYLDTSLSFNKHSGYAAEKVFSRNNILKAFAGTSWGQQKETLLMTYKAVGRSIINYAAPVWSTNLRDTNYINIKYTQNAALRFATGCRKMSSVDHLHIEAEILKVREHSELLIIENKNSELLSNFDGSIQELEEKVNSRDKPIFTLEYDSSVSKPNRPTRSMS